MTQTGSLVGTLEKAKFEMMRSSQAAGTSGQWDRAQCMLQWARELDGMILGVTQNGYTPPPTVMSPARPSRPERLPFYYTDGIKLVKVGRSRDGTTYKHR